MSGSSSPIRAPANRGRPTRSNEFLRGVKASGLPKVSFLGLRHSYASISLRAGTPLEGRFRNARSHDRDHRGSLYARDGRFESRCLTGSTRSFSARRSAVLLVRSRARGPNVGQSIKRLRKAQQNKARCGSANGNRTRAGRSRPITGSVEKCCHIWISRTSPSRRLTAKTR